MENCGCSAKHLLPCFTFRYPTIWHLGASARTTGNTSPESSWLVRVLAKRRSKNVTATPKYRKAVWPYRAFRNDAAIKRVGQALPWQPLASCFPSFNVVEQVVSTGTMSPVCFSSARYDCSPETDTLRRQWLIAFKVLPIGRENFFLSSFGCFKGSRVAVDWTRSKSRYSLASSTFLLEKKCMWDLRGHDFDASVELARK